MKRRFFLMTAAAAYAAHVSDKALAAIPVARREIAARRLLAALDRRASAAEVGRAYLAGVPQEANRACLVDALTDGLGAQGCHLGRVGKADLRAALARQIRQDFADRQVVRVDGWVLSVTEARLAGLAALAA
jgi:hypothetical protein